MELWKPILNSTNYEISNFGNVRNSITKKILKGRMSKNGYLQVSIKFIDEDKFKNQYIHRLVAQHWVDNLMNKKEVNHKDGNKLNNNAENLEWVTAQENSLHRAYTLGYIPKGKKIAQCDKEGNVLKIFDSIVEAANAFGKSRVNIDNALHNKKGQKTAYGFIWKYVE